MGLKVWHYFWTVTFMLKGTGEPSDLNACGVQGVCTCRNTRRGDYRVECGHKSLRVVPKHIPNNVTYIDFSYNSLDQLPRDFLTNMTELGMLDLAYNTLQRIPDNIFAHTGKLYNLDISGNNLSEIPERLLKSTPGMKSLRLCSNRLRQLPTGLFATTPDLQYLTLCENNMNEINKSTFHGLHSLKYLTLSRNNLSKLPADLFSEISLDEILFLSINNITEIPDGLFCSNSCSHQLQWLFLHKNKLTFLHKNSFKGLNKLTDLFLNSNNIHALGNDVFAGTKIKHVYLFSNQLTKISNTSFKSESLTEIHLYKNDISYISDEALSTIEDRVQIFVNCDQLDQLPWFNKNINISCVNCNNPPKIQLSGKSRKSITGTLSHDGFNCSSRVKPAACSPCRQGTYGDGIQGCRSCPAGGFYQDEIGSLKCKTCKNGTFVKRGEGKSSESCQVCPGGTNLTVLAGHRACFCKKNFARTHRFEDCFPCLEKGLNCSEDYKSLLPGFYWNWSFVGANIDEYSTFVQRLLNDSTYYNETSAKYTGRIPNVYSCPRRPSCANRNGFTADAIQGNCEEGYRGWLCSKCESGFYSVLGICLRCPDKIWVVVETIFALVFCIALYFFIHRQNKKSNHHGNDRSLIDKISSRMKIVLGFYQVVGELFESFHDVSWTGPLRYVGEFISLLKLSILRVIIRPHCYSEHLKIDPKLQFIISLSFPVVLIIILFSSYNTWKLYVKYRLRYTLDREVSHLRDLKNKLLTYALLLLFVTYSPTCDVIFKLYPGACKTFYMYESDMNINITLLRADYDLNCKTLKTYQSLGYVVTVIYVAAFPLVLLFLLRKYNNKRTFARLGDKRTVNQCSNLPSEQSCLIYQKENAHDFPVWLNFLCENYKPRFWYWEIIELARKVAQTVLVTLLGWEDALTKLLTIGTSVLFLTLHAKLSPMISSFEQRLQMFSLTAIFINVLVAAVNIPEIYQSPVSTVLIILNLIIILIIAGEVICALLRFIKRKYHPRKSR